MPPGSTRYWSWLFAAPDIRAPLLGVYALLAEWRALMDPATEPAAAAIKLEWWQSEMERLSSGAPMHPITQFLSTLPGHECMASWRLQNSVTAAAAQVAGAPLEKSAELEAHADALYGLPLRATTQWVRHSSDANATQRCTAALATAEYLVRATADYGRDARVGRVPFPIDELLAAGIDNDDLAAPQPPAHLQLYLQQLRHRAGGYFAAAAQALPAAERAPLRHLAVLGALGARQLQRQQGPSSADFRLADLYNAWKAARHAAAAR